MPESPLTALAMLLLLLLLLLPPPPLLLLLLVAESTEGLMGPLCAVLGVPGPADPDLSSMPVEEGRLPAVPMLEGDLWLNVAVPAMALLPLLLAL